MGILNKEMKYCLDDVAIQPSMISEINSRQQCCLMYASNDNVVNDHLPLFTAPMPTVVTKDCVEQYNHIGIIPILPRTEEVEYRISVCDEVFAAFSLQEIEKHFLKTKMDYSKPYHVLIDIANGHMKKLLTTCQVLKTIYPSMQLMAGNVANPQTFKTLMPYCDYIRVSVGSGTACTTATNLGVFYPMASLISECFELRKEAIRFNTKIIADGGMKNMRDIIKSLALGADYVMLGGMLASLIDSPAQTVIKDGQTYKEYYGMASTKGQQKLFGSDCKRTPEGKEVLLPATQTLVEFVNDFKSYLSSAMSYTNAYDLFDFTRYTQLNLISRASQRAYNNKQN